MVIVLEFEDSLSKDTTDISYILKVHYMIVFKPGSQRTMIF